MDGVEILAFLSLVLLFAAGGLVLALDLGRTSGRLARVATWLALTVLITWTLFIFAFIAVNGLYFTLGSGIAGVGLVVSALLLIAAPFVIGYFVSRISHRPGH